MASCKKNMSTMKFSSKEAQMSYFNKCAGDCAKQGGDKCTEKMASCKK